MRAFLSIVLACSAIRGSAAAQINAPQGEAPEIIRGLCQKDGCAEFAILAKDSSAKAADGELFRTRIAAYHANAQGRASQGEQNGFVYCSTTRPAVISAPNGGAAVAFMLAPDEQSPSWALRSTANFATIYFGVCHGPAAGRAAATDRARVGKSLGYRVPLAKSQTVNLNRPDDILQQTR